MEESEPEESDEYSESSDNDFVATKPASRVRNASNKTSTKADKPASEQRHASMEIMSDSESDRAVVSKEQKQSKSKSKMLGAKKTTNKNKKQEDDVSGPDVALNHYDRFSIHVAVLSLLTFLQWDSEIEESEPEESDVHSDSSGDDFVVAMPSRKPRPTGKKAPTKIDELVSKRNNVHQDTMSEDESYCSISSKKQKQSISKIEALSAKQPVNISKNREEDVSSTGC